MDKEPHNRYRRSFASTPSLRTSVDGLSNYGRRLIVPARTAQQPQPKPNIPTQTHTPAAVPHNKSQPTPPPKPIALPALDLSNTSRLILKKRPLLSRLMSRQTVIVSTVICIVALSLYVSFDSLRTNQQVKAAHDEQTAQGPSESRIDETPLPPDAIANYKVAPALPRIIQIDSIGVKARILRVGVTTNNVLDTPKNSNDTGWYDGSAKPGEAGAMLISAHYSGLTQPGVFHKIDRLKAGAIITIEKGDGTLLKFAVKKTERMPASKVPMDQLLVSPDPKAQSLNLITCAGNYDPRTQTYDERVVVYASAIR